MNIIKNCSNRISHQLILQLLNITIIEFHHRIWINLNRLVLLNLICNIRLILNITLILKIRLILNIRGILNIRLMFDKRLILQYYSIWSQLYIIKDKLLHFIIVKQYCFVIDTTHSFFKFLINWTSFIKWLNSYSWFVIRPVFSPRPARFFLVPVFVSLHIFHAWFL